MIWLMKESGKEMGRISKKVLAGILSLIMLLSMTISTQTVQVFAGESSLPEDIVANKASFDTIDAVVAQYDAQFAGYTPEPTDFVTSVNGEVRLRRLNFIAYNDAPLQVEGEVTLDIPTEIAKIFRLFGDVRLTGTLADTGVEMFIVDPDGSEHSAGNIIGHKWQGEYKDNQGNPLWTTYTKMPWIQTNGSTITTPWDLKDGNGEIDYNGYKLRLKGTGTLNFVYLWEENGMPVEYDTSAYEVMGKDLEVLDVKIDVDTTTNLSIEGVNKLEEDVFKRYHVNSGPTGIESSEGDVTLLDEVYHKTTADWGFTPGRGAFHFDLITNPLYNGGLVEDASNPGWSDFSATNEIYKKSQDAIDKMVNLYPTMGKDYVVTLDGWPSWTWEDPTDTTMDTHFATPAYSKFDSAADSAAQLVKAIDTRFDGLGPKYVEVKNESTISNEWDFFNTESKASAWAKLGEFHNIVADEVKEVNPDVLVGGPSSAFMYLERDGFEEARFQLDFMDDTKDSLDWYSHHFYENSTLYVNGRTDNSDGFLAGRFEAVMDLLRSHMVNTDNVKPILITESGSYNTLPTDIDYFQKLNGANGYMLRFLDYADTIDMLVPYLYPIINWKPNSTGTFYKYNGTKTGILEEMSPLEAYLDMWADFRGAYIPSDAQCVSEDSDTLDASLAGERVFTKAVRDGNKVYVAVHNLNRNRVNLDFDVLLGDGVSIQEVTRKHYFLENGILTYEEVPVADLDSVYVRVQEMDVFEITLNSAPDFERTLVREVDFAAEELVASSANATFTINSDMTNVEASTVRVGFGKSGSGFAGDMTLAINGNEIGTRSLDYTDKSGDVLTFMEFEVADISVINTGSNEVTVSMPEGGTISSVQITNYVVGDAPIGVDTSELDTPITDAASKMASVTVSVTGQDVAAGNMWVTQEILDTLKIEYKKATVVQNDILATTEEITEALNGLALASAILENNKKAPVAGGLEFRPISFEDGEVVDYGIQTDTEAEIVTDQGVTSGTQALKFTSNASAGGSFWLYKQIVFPCPDPLGWDVSKDGIKVDVTNPNDHEVQVRLYVYDSTPKNGFKWYGVAAGETVTIELTDLGPAPDWATGYGFATGINDKNITRIGLAFNENENQGFVEGQSMIIDNIRSSEAPIPSLESLELTMEGSVSSNENFTVSVEAGDTTDAFGLAFKLMYDSSKIEWVGYDSESDNALVLPQETPKDEEDGNVVLLITTLNDEQALSDLESIVDLSFKVKEAFDTSDIQIVEVLKSNSEGQEEAIDDASVTLHYSQLDNLLAEIKIARALLATVVEGYENDQYIIGSRSQLKAAINDAKAVADNQSATEKMFEQAIADLQNVMAIVESLKITASTGDANGDSILSLGDLTLASAHYRVDSSDPNWNKVKNLDVNKDNVIDIVDFTIIAKRIFLYSY